MTNSEFIKKNNFSYSIKNYAIQNKIIKWPFGVQNSHLVVYIGIIYTDIFTLLISYIFADDLCLYKSVDEFEDEFEKEANLLELSNEDLENFPFFNLCLTQQEYYRKYISTVYNFPNYGKFLQSALFYYLEHSIKKNKLDHFMYLFSKIITANETYTSLLYKNMRDVNIFSIFPLECLNGFLNNFTLFDIRVRFVYATKNEFLRHEKYQASFRFINCFSSYFSPKFRSTCFKDCIETKSYIPMFLALKIYKAKLLIPKLTLNNLKKINYISNFIKLIIDRDIISEKTINLLIKKNWKYYNYEQQK